jgi:hypothetical protein
MDSIPCQLNSYTPLTIIPHIEKFSNWLFSSGFSTDMLYAFFFLQIHDRFRIFDLKLSLKIVNCTIHSHYCDWEVLG